MPIPSPSELLDALSHVIDPEIRRPVTDLDMVGDLEIDDGGAVHAEIRLTVAACPLRDELVGGARDALAALDGVTSVEVTTRPMTAAEREALRAKLRGGGSDREIPFAQPGSTTRVFAIASGKGGVGKSTVTANLALALAGRGLRVGVIDADVYGFSIPRMMGADGEPTQVDDMILPAVVAGIKVISMGMLVPEGQPVVWRGPMLHRVIQQFLTDVFWGDLDVLLLDLPPGTGDVPLSVAQMLPSAEIVIVTTPQPAAADVAGRAGAMALQTRQRVAGVIENMSWLTQADGSRMELFGKGGGASVAADLSAALGAPVPLLGQIPLDMALREGGDTGKPVVVAAPDSPAAVAITAIAQALAIRAESLVGRPLGVSPL
ncbi:MAG: Mrp/NBP35 family ATP-binding protein [Bifidobacteriaceae bacterium]|jgi:ATP-binding protein involved in chromosome partitioning|nr:Mrp/NBP35 family ATP-binding protein [Bifidobacteriaceae bacterium]